MNRLSNTNELLITRFSDQLSVVVGPDDMFPPDTDHDREGIPHPEPLLPAVEYLNPASIYNFALAQRKRREIGARSAALIAKIDGLIGVAE